MFACEMTVFRLLLSEPCTIRDFGSTGLPFATQRPSEEKAKQHDVGYELAMVRSRFLWILYCTVPLDPRVCYGAGGFRQCIDRMPSVADMQGWVTGGERLETKLNQLDGRLYPVLRWIISSMRGHLRYVGSDDAVAIPQLAANNFSQFVMMCSTPTQEEKFQQLKLNNPETKYAFHGSPSENWHSIVRSGLNYNKTTHGRAYGNGIYLGLNGRTSMGYRGAMGGRSGHAAGPSARHGGYPLCLLCLLTMLLF
jgi:hypothetical protein